MTPAQRRRAVEVMALGTMPECKWRDVCVPCSYGCMCWEDAERALTALLTVADVTWKEMLK